jgi:hypothetical protein
MFPNNIWFWLSVLAAAVGLAYILVAHPALLAVLAVVVVSAALCVASWMWGGQG